MTFPSEPFDKINSNCIMSEICLQTKWSDFTIIRIVCHALYLMNEDKIL